MNRIESVDVFRFLAIVAVIMLHTAPFNPDIETGHNLAKKIYIAIDLLLTFAVPFFFIIAGYFWGSKIHAGADPVTVSTRMAKRIFIVLAAWSFLYLLPYNLGKIYDYGPTGPIIDAKERILFFIDNPLTFFVEGGKVHLWFLWAILFALPICTFFVKTGRLFTLKLVSSSLFIFGVFAYAYTNTPVGIAIDFNTRNGPFESTIFFTVGYLLSSKQPKANWLYLGAALYFCGVVLEFSEVYILGAFFKTRLLQEFVFGTFLMGVGVALMALSNHRLVRIKWMSKLGQYTLGIYACHYIFVDILRPIDKRTDNITWELGYIVIVYALSLAVTYSLCRRPLLRKIAM